MLTNFYAFCRLRTAQRKYNQGKENEAIGLLEKNVQKAPKYSFSYLYLARYYLQKNEIDKSFTYILTALELEPKNSVYIMWKGILLYEKKLYDQAKETFLQAAEYDFSNLLIQNYIALCYLQEENFQEFEKILEQKGIFESQDFQIRLLMALTIVVNKKIKIENEKKDTHEYSDRDTVK
ncbi:MAG: hypothetical protein KBC30_00210 [Planctomycetes bacterium]|jgi:Tfp pilus assembly protein PilF|nr:hypothetical protein [Planctomycetota bacterium]HPY73855.1 hypothetical protein [Planctomycetota bacterium]HQA99443.1 hypothetical protein [Planctomycetota bacterium]